MKKKKYKKLKKRADELEDLVLRLDNMSSIDQKFLQKFKKLSGTDQGRILERMNIMLNAYTPEQKNIVMH